MGGGSWINSRIQHDTQQNTTLFRKDGRAAGPNVLVVRRKWSLLYILHLKGNAVMVFLCCFFKLFSFLWIFSFIFSIFIRFFQTFYYFYILFYIQLLPNLLLYFYLVFFRPLGPHPMKLLVIVSGS